jgi:hypothetical protein
VGKYPKTLLNHKGVGISPRDRPEGRAQTLSAIGVVTILVATAGFVGWFGVSDLTEALTYVGRFTGAVFVIAAVTLLIGALATLDHWFKQGFQYSGAAALVGACIAVAVNAMLFITALRDGDRRIYLIYWSILLAGSLWAVYVVYRTRLPTFGPAKLTLALLISSGLAVANFGYAQLYLPYSQAVNTLLEVGFGTPALNANSSIAALPVSVKLTNRGKVGVYVLGAEYVVLGRKAAVHPAGRPPSQWRKDVMQWREITRNTAINGYDIVQKSGWYAPFGHPVEGGEEYSTNQIVHLPLNMTYDEVLVKATAVLVRKDRLVLDHDYGQPQEYSWNRARAPKPHSIAGMDYVKYQGRIHENNAVAEHIRRPRHVTLWWIVNGPAGVTPFITTIARAGEETHDPSPVEERRNESRYGLITEQTGWLEKPLWGLFPAHP